MATLLHLDSSPLETSVSRELGREFVKTWQLAHPGSTVVYRDLAKSAPKPLDAAWIYAAYTPEADRTAEQKATLALSDELIAELEQADEYVIDVAMHNFGVPATLKLWIDQISRAGKTFVYTETGPQGLLKGKKVTLLVATGGNYAAGTPYSAFNFVDPYLTAVFKFLGVSEVKVVAAGGTAQLMSPEVNRAAFLEPTIEQVRAVVA